MSQYLASSTSAGDALSIYTQRVCTLVVFILRMFTLMVFTFMVFTLVVSE